ncbi:RNA-directed DNA polymerase [Patescibacteria group bacterium]|nr:RNA-directed DNA polymerase [Patescibacteria group bacterium]MBU1957114.1 RNA-directed DNA polymerase [bacterium]
MFTFKNVYQAYKDCRKYKTNTLNALKFEQNLLENLWDLVYDLQNRSYKIGTSICFLTHSPKLREVFAADFRDRVVHHLLINAIEPYYEKRFINDIYNNRKGKGIHQAVKRAQKFMHKTSKGYYLQLDIKGFFYNLDKNILFKMLFDDVQRCNKLHPTDNKTSQSVGCHFNAPFNRHDKEILYLANRIIYHDPTRNYNFKGDQSKLKLLPEHKTLFKLPKHKGLPIGNLTSQFFGNVYMNRFDNFLKRELKVKHYLRYVDDFVLFDHSKERLEKRLLQIRGYLKENLALNLREDVKLKPHSSGLDFLGYIIREDYLLTRQRVVNNYKAKKAVYLNSYEAQRGNMSLAEIKKFLSVQASFVSHIQHANSFNLMNKVGKLDENNPFDYDRT